METNENKYAERECMFVFGIVVDDYGGGSVVPLDIHNVLFGIAKRENGSRNSENFYLRHADKFKCP